VPWWLQSSAQPILAQVVRATARPGAPPLQELIAAAFDIQCVYRPEIKQAIIVLTSTAALGEAHAARAANGKSPNDRRPSRRLAIEGTIQL
jgi:hypothetical protein